MTRLLYNLFRVNDSDYDAINAWVIKNAEAGEAEKMKPGDYPKEFSVDWRVAAQAAFSRMFSETPYIVVFGAAAMIVLPALILLSLML